MNLDYASLLNEIEQYRENCRKKCEKIKKSQMTKEEKAKAIKSQKEQTKKIIEEINVKLHEPYNNFQKSTDTYLFTELIGVECCPYCNLEKIPTTFQKNKDGEVISTTCRPDIDHFESQKKAPEKQLELTNLVPSCQTCNRTVKLQKEFSLSTHLNPYIEDFDNHMYFSLNLIDPNNYKDEKNFEILITASDNSHAAQLAENNVVDLELRQRYQKFKKDVVQIMENKSLYDANKQLEIIDVTGVKKSLREILFPDEKCDINKTERGKLKRDIISRYIK